MSKYMYGDSDTCKCMSMYMYGKSDTCKCMSKYMYEDSKYMQHKSTDRPKDEQVHVQRERRLQKTCMKPLIAKQQ